MYLDSWCHYRIESDIYLLCLLNFKAVGETTDWINELPDSIIAYILSSLRIKDAAETSIVCRRWRNLWKTRPSDLVLDIANIFGSVYAPVVARHGRYDSFASMIPRFEKQCYIQRVNKVLELLSCNKLDLFKVAFWVIWVFQPFNHCSGQLIWVFRNW